MPVGGTGGSVMRRGRPAHRPGARRRGTSTILPAEQAQHTVLRSCRTWRDQPRPVFSCQLFAHRLEGWPTLSPWARNAEPDASQLLVRREVGNRHLDRPPPEGAGQGVGRRDSVLGQVAIPLRPGRALLIGEIQRLHDRAPLPAVVGRQDMDRQRCCADGCVAKPAAGDSDRIDVQGQRDQTAPGSSSDAMSFATRRYSPAAMRSTGLSSSSASMGLVSHSGM